MWPCKTITHSEGAAETLRRGRYGVIEMRDGRFVAVHLRPFPTLVSLPRMRSDDRRRERMTGDRCWLYYNQPLFHSNFMSLVYVFSTGGGSIASLYGGLCVLDEIARLKRTDALLCEASNERISERLMRRWGWEPHVPESLLRHFIKRFYGEYPPQQFPNAYGIPAWSGMSQARGAAAESVVSQACKAV